MAPPPPPPLPAKVLEALQQGAGRNVNTSSEVERLNGRALGAQVAKLWNIRFKDIQVNILSFMSSRPFVTLFELKCFLERSYECSLVELGIGRLSDYNDTAANYRVRKTLANSEIKEITGLDIIKIIFSRDERGTKWSGDKVGPSHHITRTDSSFGCSSGAY
jgi:hypothetical protein